MNAMSEDGNLKNRMPLCKDSNSAVLNVDEIGTAFRTMHSLLVVTLLAILVVYLVSITRHIQVLNIGGGKCID